MATLTTAKAITITDYAAAIFNALRGTSGNNAGFGDSTQVLGSDWGASKGFRDLQNAVAGFADPNMEQILIGGINNLVNQAGYTRPTRLTRLRSTVPPSRIWHNSRSAARSRRGQQSIRACMQERRFSTSQPRPLAARLAR